MQEHVQSNNSRPQKGRLLEQSNPSEPLTQGWIIFFPTLTCSTIPNLKFSHEQEQAFVFLEPRECASNPVQPIN